MPHMTLSDPVTLPDQYRPIVLAFLRQYLDDLVWELRNHLGIELDVEVMPATDDDYLRLMIADSIAEMSRAAAGDVTGLDPGDVNQGIQDLVEKLFSIPGAYSYTIPQEFWHSPFGGMVMAALIWSQGDELITLSQAAEISGRSIGDLSNMIRRKRLTAYADPSEVNPQRQMRVSRCEIERLSPPRRRS